MTHPHNIIDTASETIEAAVAQAAMGEDVWWSLSTTLIPTPEGPHAVYILMLHMRSSLLGSPPLTNVAMFENALDLLHSDKVGDHVAKMVEGLRQNRSSLLSTTPPPTKP